MKRMLSAIITVILAFTAVFSVACSKEGDNAYVKYIDANSVMNSLIDDSLDFGLLPEPAATKLEDVKGEGYDWYRLDVQELYNSETKAYPQAVLMVKNSVLEDFPSVVSSLKAEMINATTYAKSNTDSVVNAISEKYSSTSLKPAQHLTGDTIDNCKIYWEDATSAKNSVNAYLNDILSSSVGLGITVANKVEDSFFYSAKGGEGDYSNENFTFTVPDGAPALAIANLIATNSSFGAKAVEYNVVSAEDINGYVNGAFYESDFVIMPLNAATLHYNGKYTMVSVVTHGNLYLMSKTSASSINDLINKKVGVIGQGKVPDLTLKSILKKAKIGVEVII